MKNLNSTEELLEKLDFIHTTELGIGRLRRGLCLKHNIDPVTYIKNNLQRDGVKTVREGKNYYVNYLNEMYVINASSYTIITAKLI